MGLMNSSKNKLNSKKSWTSKLVFAKKKKKKWDYKFLKQKKKQIFNVRLVKIIFANLFYYLAYFCYYLWVSLYFLVQFMDITVLFQLTFTFIYGTFTKKFSVSVK